MTTNELVMSVRKKKRQRLDTGQIPRLVPWNPHREYLMLQQQLTCSSEEHSF